LSIELFDTILPADAVDEMKITAEQKKQKIIFQQVIFTDSFSFFCY